MTAADDVDDKEPQLDLLLSGDDNEDDEDFPVKLSASTDVPIKAQKQLDRALYNRSRIRHHGASKTHMPDFSKMVKSDNKSMTDLYDTDFVKSYLRNPFGESVERPKYKTPINRDTIMILRAMESSQKFASQRRYEQEKKTALLSESNSEEDVADTKEYREVYVIDDDEE